ncbi:hypothetical protein E2C01_036320 [Portunus trituberculatus]|uniref:Uncharacterized protein n=1 Tax=Portunus trituberculatus TaxID=210409 RepID=A0A5B7FC50_PORTR|nr:hypothetical protein [Portunus trituberculatus]
MSPERNIKVLHGEKLGQEPPKFLINDLRAPHSFSVRARSCESGPALVSRRREEEEEEEEEGGGRGGGGSTGEAAGSGLNGALLRITCNQRERQVEEGAGAGRPSCRGDEEIKQEGDRDCEDSA